MKEGFQLAVQSTGLALVAFVVWNLWKGSRAGTKRISKTNWAVSVFVVTIGFGLLCFNRIREIPFPGGKLALEAERDSRIIAEHKREAETNSGIIELIASDAKLAKYLAEEATKKNLLAEDQLKQLQAKSAVISEVMSNVLAKVNELNDATSDATLASKTVQQTAEFLTRMTAALSGDLPAYRVLLAVSRDSSSPFQDQARRITTAAAYINMYTPLGGRFLIEWKEGVDPQKLTMLELSDTYHQVLAQQRPTLVEMIGKRNDFSKKEKLQFFISVIESDNDLRTVSTAVHFFAQTTGLKSSATDFEQYSRWWQANKDVAESKPPDSH